MEKPRVLSFQEMADFYEQCDRTEGIEPKLQGDREQAEPEGPEAA